MKGRKKDVGDVRTLSGNNSEVLFPLHVLEGEVEALVVLALGLFFLTSNVISVLSLEILSIFVYPPPMELIDWTMDLQLVVASSMIAVRLGLILKRIWDKKSGQKYSLNGFVKRD